MKLIIEIDDKRIKGIKLLAKEQDIATPYPTLEQIIANGIPLDKHDEEIIAETVESIWGKPPYTDVLNKIREEIDEIPLSEPIVSADGLYCYGSRSISMGHFREKVFEIIDRYRRENDE